MARMTARVASRITAGLKRFHPILDSARARDINESDTVVIVADLLQYVLGYDKYSEITSEYAIRGTYCDLAVKVDGRLALLIEVKAIGLDLKDNHVKQAVDYAANQGCEWVVLTNGVLWRAYKILFAKPITHELVLDLNLCSINPKNDEDLGLLWLLTKEGLQKSGLADYHAQREALSRFTLGAILTSGGILDVLRRELRRVSPEARISTEEIHAVLVADVLKREVLEGEKAEAARKIVARVAARALRSKPVPSAVRQPGVAVDTISPAAVAPPPPAPL